MLLQSLLCLIVLVLGCVVVCGQRGNEINDCNAHLERARSYEIVNDKRAEREFKSALTDGGTNCPSALFELSQHFSRRLRFNEAAEALKNYIERTPNDDHVEDHKELAIFEHAAIVKDRVENAEKPTLQDLLELTGLAGGYGREKTSDAMPFAEKAVSLYPESVDALLQLAGLLSPTKTDNNRVEQLLNKAASIDSNNPKVFSRRGWFYLFTMGRRVDAENEFRRALSLSGDKDPLAWKGLGYIFMFKGQKQQAVEAFSSYLKLTHSDEPDSEVGTLIEKLKRDPTQ